MEQAVEWCTDMDMGIIIGWRSIENLAMEIFPNPMYNATRNETYHFWLTISSHFSGAFFKQVMKGNGIIQ